MYLYLTFAAFNFEVFAFVGMHLDSSILSQVGTLGTSDPYSTNVDYFVQKLSCQYPNLAIQTPTRIPEKIVVALFSGILVNSGIQVEAGRHITV